MKLKLSLSDWTKGKSSSWLSLLRNSKKVASIKTLPKNGLNLLAEW
jgi:hypothetical protein